jgi:MobA-like NTP transferase domain
MLRAVITAGGSVDAAFAAEIGTSLKALAPSGTGVLIDAVLNAIEGAGISDVAIVGEPAVTARFSACGALPIGAAADGATNVLRALDAWPDGDLLYATCDLPFITREALVAFLAASAPYDLTLPLASEAAYLAAFPGAPPHVAALGGERVANGSVFFIRHAAREPVRRIAGRFFDARKSLFGMARLLGPALLMRFLVRRLRISHIESHASQVLGVRAAAIREQSPGLCYDIDTLDDYRYACRAR